VATVPGASAVLRGGVVVYATELKASLGGVPRDVLDADGAVAPTTARYLAAHIRETCGATLGVALTGVAGPEPQEGKPVGQVFIGIADGKQATAQLAGNVLFRHNYADKQATSDIIIGGHRETIRRLSVSAALSSCCDWLAEFDVDGKQRR
jgi:putative competence-damage inducible protein